MEGEPDLLRRRYFSPAPSATKAAADVAFGPREREGVRETALGLGEQGRQPLVLSRAKLTDSRSMLMDGQGWPGHSRPRPGRGERG